jgi:hypothetical protein
MLYLYNLYFSILQGGSMMFTLIDVTVPAANVRAVQAELERCCAVAGDLLIGRRRSDEMDTMQFTILLLQQIHHTQHVAVLDRALQQDTISSFQSANYERMINLFCDSSFNIEERLLGFPLRSGESCFPDVVDEGHGYLFTRYTLMTPKQTSWLQEREVKWEDL